MNNQQELINAINSISNSRNKSYDTPATVLRVEGDTVWVHIDGGADETPVQKTINCAQGETVQVRISNGSAFLVGNASAPPTDDKVANVAHFVAVEADEKATTAIRSVDAISQTVEGKVDVGDSNIEVLSSTMLQNANGVNIYNGNLAVGDSYAHIDGDSFDIKRVTTAGTIDDVNDTVLATFSPSGTIIYGQELNQDRYYIKLDNSSIQLFHREYMSSSIYSDVGWKIDDDAIAYRGSSSGTSGITIDNTQKIISIPPSSPIMEGTQITQTGASFMKSLGAYGFEQTIIDGGDIKISGKITDLHNDPLLDEWTPTAQVASDNTVTFTGLSDLWAYELFCLDKLIGISSMTMTGSDDNVTLKFTVTGASAGDYCKLRIIH